MGVTLVVCGQPGCNRMLNGEVCYFDKETHVPYCPDHATYGRDPLPPKSKKS